MSKRTLMQSTQVMIAIQISGDREHELVSLITMLTQALAFLWGLWMRANRLRREVEALLEDCQEAASFTVKVMAIGLTALAFGFLGVRL